jgi:hypothetical protein
VWLVWRSRISYSLKAATLAAGALIATPFAVAYDMTALVIPAAFLAEISDVARRPGCYCLARPSQCSELSETMPTRPHSAARPSGCWRRSHYWQ